MEEAGKPGETGREGTEEGAKTSSVRIFEGQAPSSGDDLTRRLWGTPMTSTYPTLTPKQGPSLSQLDGSCPPPTPPSSDPTVSQHLGSPFTQVQPPSGEDQGTPKCPAPHSARAFPAGTRSAGYAGGSDP